MDMAPLSYPRRVAPGYVPVLGSARPERRWSPRRAWELPVRIYAQQVAVADGATHDLGLEGMFIATQWQDFVKHMPLEIEFTPLADRDASRFRLPVVAIHHSSHGVGVMFTVFNQKVFRLLEHFLYETDAPPSC